MVVPTRLAKSTWLGRLTVVTGRVCVSLTRTSFGVPLAPFSISVAASVAGCLGAKVPMCLRASSAKVPACASARVPECQRCRV